MRQTRLKQDNRQWKNAFFYKLGASFINLAQATNLLVRRLHARIACVIYTTTGIWPGQRAT